MNKNAANTALLPQYQSSLAFMERFLVAAHEEDVPIMRSPSNQGIKLVDGSELSSDALDYFTMNTKSFREEFERELEEKISPEEFQIFCEVISKEWFDGKRLREKGRPYRLKRSVHDYLQTVHGSSFSVQSLVQVQEDILHVEPLLSAEAIKAILSANDYLLHQFLEEWKREHPNCNELTNGDIFLRRGLALQSELDTSVPYREWDYINSYSIAFSAPEKFSQAGQGLIPAIVNAELSLFQGRVLFFSPFVPGMDVRQLEFGVIPSGTLLPIHCQGRHADVLEYIIDPAPFQLFGNDF